MGDGADHVQVCAEAKKTLDMFAGYRRASRTTVGNQTSKAEDGEAILRHARPHYAMVRYAMICEVTVSHAAGCTAMLCHATLLCYVMLCHATLCYAMTSYGTMCYAVLREPRRHGHSMRCYSCGCSGRVFPEWGKEEEDKKE
eukprot:5652540-Pyramimonas_sp.AAC.1